MSKYPPIPRPEETPWGDPQLANQVLPGIWTVSTATHGGLVLSDQRQADMPDALQLTDRYYEEDCDWALVYVAYADEFLRASLRCGPDFIQLARDTTTCWHPDRMAKHTGQSNPENQSHVLKTRAAYQAAIGEFCATSAWGDWAEWVPEGKVGVLAKKLVSVDHLGRPTYENDEVFAHVDKKAYNDRGEVTPLSTIDHETIAPPESVRPKRVA